MKNHKFHKKNKNTRVIQFTNTVKVVNIMYKIVIIIVFILEDVFKKLTINISFHTYYIRIYFHLQGFINCFLIKIS
jgi:hypothetical protein